MANKKRQQRLEYAISFFAWASGLVTSLVVAYGVWSGSIAVPELLSNHLFSDILGWTIGSLAVMTVILSFFRK
jgi:hypothetical protein